MIASAEWMFLLALFLPPATVVIGLATFVVASYASGPEHAPAATHVQAV